MDIKHVEIQVTDVRTVHRQESRYRLGRAFVRLVRRTIVVLWQEWERVLETGGKNHAIDPRQDLVRYRQSVRDTLASDEKRTVPFISSTRPDWMVDPSGMGKNCLISPTSVVFLGILRM